MTAFDWPASGALSGTMVGTATAPAVILILCIWCRQVLHKWKLYIVLKIRNKYHKTYGNSNDYTNYLISLSNAQKYSFVN